jgi:very-short-patch-repair endonuclease
MLLQSNDWNRVRAFYDWASPMILAERADEWAIDPYAWCEGGMIRMTPIEEWLWADLREANAIIYPQYPVLRYFVDFANPVAKIAIECDGKDYHKDRDKDQARDAELEAIGWRVYRFAGWECATDTDEETGEPGRARQRVRQICAMHDISRNCTQRHDRGQILAPRDVWASVREMFEQDARRPR